MTIKRLPAAVAMVLAMAGLVACGGGGSSPTTPTVAATPAPGVTIEGSGNGSLTIHPSASSGFAVAIEVPIRIRETGGGTANWNWARLSLYRNGVEIERKEIGSDVIAGAGINQITARQDQNYRLTYRFNSSNFDIFTVTLGFSDMKDARQFTTQIPNTSFSGVNLSLTPLDRPGPAVYLGR